MCKLLCIHMLERYHSARTGRYEEVSREGYCHTGDIGAKS